jgi:hypothetical protein
LDFCGRRIRAAISVFGRDVLGGLIVGLNRGQFIDELFTAAKLPDFRKMNFAGKMCFAFDGAICIVAF